MKQNTKSRYGSNVDREITTIFFGDNMEKFDYSCAVKPRVR